VHIAYCNASGVIGFAEGKTPSVPDGALVIATGDKSTMGAIRACARLAYDNKTYLVPGVPEAENQSDGIDALMKWRDWMKSRSII